MVEELFDVVFGEGGLLRGGYLVKAWRLSETEFSDGGSDVGEFDIFGVFCGDKADLWV